MGEPEVSIVMPCLNEEETVGTCVDDARSWLEKSGTSGEILVIDNGCTDRSARVAEEHGARVIPESRGGYGYALRRGFAESRGRVILMGDCDTTYDFRNLDPFQWCVWMKSHISCLVKPESPGQCDQVITGR